MRFPVIAFEQPAGAFFLTAMPAVEVIRMAKADPRRYDRLSMGAIGGIQREPSTRRINEIAEYSGTVDAAFPTPILLALEEGSYSFIDNEIDIARDAVADIVDGQHRIRGLQLSSHNVDFVLPVVLIVEATEEQKALLFAIINGKQTRVPASLVYDLFGVTTSGSPYKTAHEIARALNSTPTSPWFKRLKMLGRKSEERSTETLSQGTFVKFLLPMISKNPDRDMNLLKQDRPPDTYEDCVFNEYFRTGNDSIILRILTNLFQAARETWPEEWDNPTASILTKTLGFSGIMRALPEVIKAGRQQGDLSKEYMRKVFDQTKALLTVQEIRLTSAYFSSSASGEARLRDFIIEAVHSLRAG